MRGINDEATSQGHIQRRSSGRIICGRGEGGGLQKGRHMVNENNP